jgi:hypothetical protein
MDTNRTSNGGPPPARYRRWVAALAGIGWICQGSVVRRTLRRRVAGAWVDKGPYYYWTCKVAGKTVCHALSRVQYQHLHAAIAAHRRVVKVLARLHAATLHAVLNNLPGVAKRK